MRLRCHKRRINKISLPAQARKNQMQEAETENMLKNSCEKGFPFWLFRKSNFEYASYKVLLLLVLQQPLLLLLLLILLLLILLLLLPLYMLFIHRIPFSLLFCSLLICNYFAAYLEPNYLSSGLIPFTLNQHSVSSPR